MDHDGFINTFFVVFSCGSCNYFSPSILNPLQGSADEIKNNTIEF
jgi:hypothetical protein